MYVNTAVFPWIYGEYVIKWFDKSAVASIPIFGHFDFWFLDWLSQLGDLDCKIRRFFGLNICLEKWNIFDKSTRKVLLSLFEVKSQWIPSL